MRAHTHFVQSLEPLEGGGLGAAALGLHLALRSESATSTLATTRCRSFTRAWPGVVQSARCAIPKLFYAPGLSASVRDLIERAQVVHGHGLYVYPNWVCGSWARTYKVPLVYHPHGFLDPWILRRSKIKKKVAHFLFEAANFRDARLWRALSGKEADQIRSAGVSAPIVVVPNGVNLSELDDLSGAPADLPHSMKRRPHRLLFLGRIHPKKGLDLLVSVWSKLTKEFADWELVIVGPDEGGYRREIENMIRRADLEETCQIYGTVTGTAKNVVFRSADIFVLPSYSEGMPVAVLEAAAHNRPVVLTTECNFSELAEAGAAWETLPRCDALEKTLRVAMSASPSERLERGAAGRALVEARFSWRRVAELVDAACGEYCS